MSGHELKAAREAAGLSQMALAERARLSRDTVRKLEAGLTKARGTTLHRLRAALAHGGAEDVVAAGGRSADLRAYLHRMIDEGDDLLLGFMYAQCEHASRDLGFAHAHEPTVACRPVTRGKAPAAGPLAVDTEFGPELRPRQVPLFRGD